MYIVPNSKNKPDTTIREVQSMLNAIRIYYHHNWEYLTTDGIYGPNTAKAVKKFHEYRGISSQMSPMGPILGDTTVSYIRELYNTIPQISNAPAITTRTEQNNINISKIGFDLLSLLTNDGAPIFKKLEEAFPLAFRRLTQRSNTPYFVFTKQEAYHNGAKYARFNLPDNVSRYLGYIGVAWSWVLIFQNISEYRKKCKTTGISGLEIAKMSADIFATCTSTIDTILTLPACRQLATRIAGRYAVAQTGAAFSAAGATALSTAGMCIGAFLLGCELGTIIGKIPIGNGLCFQDVVNDYIDLVWEHPYKTLGLSPIASVIDAWKKFIEWKVNHISNLKPLTPAEKQKLELYLMQNREMQLYATPPNAFFIAK